MTARRDVTATRASCLTAAVVFFAHSPGSTAPARRTDSFGPQIGSWAWCSCLWSPITLKCVPGSADNVKVIAPISRKPARIDKIRGAVPAELAYIRLAAIEADRVLAQPHTPWWEGPYAVVFVQIGVRVLPHAIEGDGGLGRSARKSSRTRRRAGGPRSASGVNC